MSQLDVERLENAIHRIAQLIELSGEDFWPVLERLEAERDALKSRQQRLVRYLSKSKHRPR